MSCRRQNGAILWHNGAAYKQLTSLNSEATFFLETTNLPRRFPLEKPRVLQHSKRERKHKNTWSDIPRAVCASSGKLIYISFQVTVQVLKTSSHAAVSSELLSRAFWHSHTNWNKPCKAN
ncbi:hypothetical protein VPH35_085458 [Triticum aestivum]